MADVVGFNVINDVMDLLMSDKEKLSRKDFVGLQKESREEAGGEGTEEVECMSAHK